MMILLVRNYLVKLQGNARLLSKFIREMEIEND